MSNWTGRGFLVPRFRALHVGVFDETRKRRPRPGGISDRCSVNSCLFQANKNSRHVGVSTSRDKSPRRNYALIRCSRTAVFLVVRNDERERVRAVRGSIEWRGRMKQRGKERKKKRKKDLKEKVSRVSNGTKRNGKWRARWLEVTAAEIHQMEEITPVSMPGTMTRPADACFCIPALLSSSLVLSFPILPLFFSSSFFPFFLFFSAFHPDSITTPRRPIPRGTVFQAVQRTAEWVGEL